MCILEKAVIADAMAIFVLCVSEALSSKVLTSFFNGLCFTRILSSKFIMSIISELNLFSNS